MSKCNSQPNPTKHTIGEVVRKFLEKFVKKYKPNKRILKVLLDIGMCKTKELGGHYVYCTGCGYEKRIYNSCGNGSCPQCQQIRRLLWIDKTVDHLLPVRHFHVIFTLPHELNDLLFYNQRELYKVFFHSSWESISAFTGTGQSGMVSTLHTWGSRLSYHPHLHCIVADGNYDGKDWQSPRTHNSRFFVKAKLLRKKFKEIFLKKFRMAIEESDNLYYDGHPAENEDYREIEKIYEKVEAIKDWSLRIEFPVCGQNQIVEYLGRYVSRIAITNSRITDVTDKEVVFTYKKYAQQKKGKPAPIGHQRMDGETLLQQFSQHILPRYLHRVRYFGVYAFSNKPKREAAYESITKHPKPAYKKPSKRFLIKKMLGSDPDVCPACAMYQSLIVIPFEGSKCIHFNLGNYWSFPSLKLRRYRLHINV